LAASDFSVATIRPAAYILKPIRRATAQATPNVIAPAVVWTGAITITVTGAVAGAVSKTVIDAVVGNITESATGAVGRAETVPGLPTLALFATVGSAAPYQTADIRNIFNPACFIDDGSKSGRYRRRHRLGARHHEKLGQRDGENKASQNQPTHVALLFHVESTPILMG
jgi:hypothetical protein